ncbi:hypothetical protein AB0K02_16875 [Streptomyces sp. NPDC049597]|uniref:hypothetical protein n=1 Tax=Streptomyces sp. NPDC049597 TaxID=3155276 RepID=UPI00343C02A4
MNASRVTGNTAPEEPTAVRQDPGEGRETAVGDDHVRAVWALAALTALDDMRAESPPGGARGAGPEPSSERERSGVEGGGPAGGAPGRGGGPERVRDAGVQDRSFGEGETLDGARAAEPPRRTAPAGAPSEPQAGGGRAHGGPGALLGAVDPAAVRTAPTGAPPEPQGGGGRAHGGPGALLGVVDPAAVRTAPTSAPSEPQAAGGLAHGGPGAPPGAVDPAAAGGPRADGHRQAPAESKGGPAQDGAVTRGAAVRDRFGSARAPVRGESASGAVRRGGVDPVKGLIHRHRDLCEQAVDPLEIAAGLEAHGLTDRTAARFRHRDVFSLAEEMFARAERVPATTDDRPAHAADSRAGRAGTYLTTLLPGLVCALAVAGTVATEGTARLASGVIGALATGLALLFALRSGPLRARGRTLPAARLWTLWLLLYAAGGQGLTAEILAGGPDGPWPLTPAPVVVLALAVAPAAWCADLFAARARRRLGASRGLDDFAAGTRPLLLAVLLLYVAALGALVALTGLVLPGAGTLGPAAVLGTLLFLARLLVVHGFPEPASAALAAACAAEAAAPALLLSGRLPGLDVVARPVEALVAVWGTAAVPLLACGAAALGLAAHAFAVLARASAHTR